MVTAVQRGGVVERRDAVTSTMRRSTGALCRHD